MNPESRKHRRASTSLVAALAAALSVVTFASGARAADGDRYVHRDNHYYNYHRAPAVRYHAAPYYHNYPRGYAYGYRYRDPYYAYGPPPVVYEPAPSPGISLFFGF